MNKSTLKPFKNILGTGFLMKRFRVQNHCMAPRSSQLFNFTRSIKQTPGILGRWVAKSKLCFWSDSVALRQLNPIHKEEPWNYFLFVWQTENMFLNHNRTKPANVNIIILKQGFIQAILMSGTKELNLLNEFSNGVFIKFYCKEYWGWTCIWNKLP